MEFLENLDILSIEKIRQIELCTRGQCCNEQWYLCRKGVITASKAIEVITKMRKVRKGGGGVVNIWSLKEKNSRMTVVNPNIPTLKYGRDMEIEAVNTFVEYIKNYQQDCIISECGLVLNETVPYIGTNPDRLMSCSFCGKACTEIKCSYSINYTEPNEQNLDYLHKDEDTVKLNQNLKYFTQCLMQMGVTKPRKAYFVVWTTHGMVIDIITFDNELWESMKSNFEMFYKDFHLNSFFSE